MEGDKLKQDAAGGLPRKRAETPLKDRFLGRSLSRTLIGLVVASILVGALFSFLGVSPREFWSGLFNFIEGIVSMLGDSLGEIVGSLATYLLLGAAIVVPIWFVSRLLSGGRRK